MILFVFKSSRHCIKQDDGRSFVSLLVFMLCHLIATMGAVKKAVLAAGWAAESSHFSLVQWVVSEWVSGPHSTVMGQLLFPPGRQGESNLQRARFGGAPSAPTAPCMWGMRHGCTPSLNTDYFGRLEVAPAKHLSQCLTSKNLTRLLFILVV